VFASVRLHAAKFLVVASLSSLCLPSLAGSMRLMTVAELKQLGQRGKSGEVAATAYVQGAVEAYLNMDAIVSSQNKLLPAFCEFGPAYKAGIEHPASLAPAMIAKWEAEGMGMDKPAMQMVRMYLMVKFGSRCSDGK
jgi:hypothetical protein